LLKISKFVRRKGETPACARVTGKQEGTELLLVCRPLDQNRRIRSPPMNEEPGCTVPVARFLFRKIVCDL
jgi:hypothetical protein